MWRVIKDTLLGAFSLAILLALALALRVIWKGVIWWHTEHTAWAARIDVALVGLPFLWLVGWFSRKWYEGDFDFLNEER